MIHVVDTTATVEEMNWALDQYGRSFAVGRLYSAVKYDTMHVRAGTVKRVTARDLACRTSCGTAASASTRPIRVYRGQGAGCADGNRIWDSAQAAHAWLGFFQYSDARWNFDVGRFESYKGVQGRIIDPQTRERVPDTHVGLLAEMAATNPQGRQTAQA